MVSDRAKACPHCGGPIDDNVIRMSRMQSRQQQPHQLQQPVSPQVKVSQMAQNPVRPQQVHPQQAGQQQQAMGNAGGLTKECVNCHRHIRQEQTFCKYCGARQISVGYGPGTNPGGHVTQQQRAAVVDSSEKGVAYSPTKPSPNPTGIANPDNQQPAKKSNKRSIFIIAGIIAILIVGALYYLFQNENIETRTEIANNNEETISEDEKNDIEYLKLNDVWDWKEIKSVTYQNLFSSIKNGEVANFLNLAQSYINVDKANGYIKEVYNILEENPNLQDDAKTIFQEAVKDDKIDLALLHNNLQNKANSKHNSGDGGTKKHSSNTSRSSKSSKSENDGVAHSGGGTRPSGAAAQGGASRPSGDGAAQGGASRPGGGGAAGQGGSRPSGGGSATQGGGSRPGGGSTTGQGGGQTLKPRKNGER